MEKSISNRLYFDYNATSPLAKRVTNFLHSGDFLFGNPASIHETGRRSKKAINETIDYLYQLFKLNKKEHHLFFHSGATEGINSIFKGMAFKLFKEKKAGAFFFSEVDHASVIELKVDLEALGHVVHFFSPDKTGFFDRVKLVEDILKAKNQGREVFLNYTYVNNETGIIWPLAWAVELKKETGVFIHIDAVQAVGKIDNWEIIFSDLDSYTFSGHKFGALKGVGFTFLNTKTPCSPLIVGGNQQAGLRAGTENALGVYSLKLALLDMQEKFKASELSLAKNLIEENLIAHIGSRGEIVGRNFPHRNLNTIFLILYKEKAEMLLAKFDMQGIDLSMGSACSSGIVKENRILRSMGYGQEDARAALRFSFSPFMTKNEALAYIEKIKSIVGDHR